jgi:hypothetical protein
MEIDIHHREEKQIESRGKSAIRQNRRGEIRPTISTFGHIGEGGSSEKIPRTITREVQKSLDRIEEFSPI